VSYECEIPEFYSEDFPKARKVHRCCECSAPIEVGEKHLYARSKYDGDFWHGRQHMLCRALCMLMRVRDFGDCVPFEGMKDEWTEGDWQFENKHGYPGRQGRLLMARIIKRERAAQRAQR